MNAPSHSSLQESSESAGAQRSAASGGRADTGWGDPRDCGETPQNEERRQAATPAALDRKIDKTTDNQEDTEGRPQAQAYPIRLLI
jgi:hypothetical protein